MLVCAFLSAGSESVPTCDYIVVCFSFFCCVGVGVLSLFGRFSGNILLAMDCLSSTRYF